MDYSSLIARKDADFNEEQTKHAMVLPILDRILGWDIYDNLRLIPEYTADTPGKNGEKVDYALDVEGDGKPEVLIEVKPLGSRLNSKGAAQLYRYFTMTEAIIGVLTDGYRWMIYSDLDKPNVMDNEPFLDFDLEDLATKKPLEKLFRSLAFETFDASYLRAWGELSRDTERLRKLVKDELSEPSDDFSKYFFYKLNPGARATSSKLEVFKSRLRDVLDERTEEFEEVQTLEMKSKSPKVTHPRRVGYIQSDKGHRSEAGNLRKAWIEYWSKIASDPEFSEKLLEIAINNEPKGALSIDPQAYFDPISSELYIAYNLSSERRIDLLGRLSKLIGIESEIIYTDLEESAE